jgi:hypothetical protein
MKKLFFLLVAFTASAHAQTYDISGWVGPESFAGTFTYANGTLTNVDVSDSWARGTFTTGSAGGDYITLMDWGGQNPNGPVVYAPDELDLSTNAPIGSSSLKIVSALYDGSVPVPSDYFLCAGPKYRPDYTCGGHITEVRSVNAAPELDWSRAIAALTLLAGCALVLNGARRRST